ncbi:MAG: hypothetical protein ACFFDW_09220 [Candidatus Thorarchaeota archaeon]
MKKINPKVIGIVTLLLSVLVASSLAVQDGFGDPTVVDPGDDTGN